MKESRTFNVELTEFAALVIGCVMRSDAAEERALDYIDSQLPDDADTAGLTREEFVAALYSRVTTGLTAIQVALYESKQEAA